jgi:hypothetical protein
VSGVQNPWVKSYQAAWAEDAQNPTLDAWFRVMAAAYGRIQANGHAPFGKGELSRFLQMNAPAVSKAIKRAVSKGLLDHSSTARCLVLPPHRVAGGVGDPGKPCPVHDCAKRVR